MGGDLEGKADLKAADEKAKKEAAEPKDPKKTDVPSTAPYAGTDEAKADKEAEKAKPAETDDEKKDVIKKELEANPNKGKVASDKAAEDHDVEAAGKKAN